MRGVRTIIVAVEKQLSITYSVALGIQHTKRMRRIILLSVASLALLYFSTLPYKGYDFWKTLLKMKCVLIFSTTIV